MHLLLCVLWFQMYFCLIDNILCIQSFSGKTFSVQTLLKDVCFNSDLYCIFSDSPYRVIRLCVISETSGHLKKIV